LKVLLALCTAAILIAFGAACSDDGGPEEAVEVTPVGTKEATPVPEAVNPGEAPAPVEPEVDEELSEVVRGELEAVIEPGLPYEIDPETLAAEAGVTDACDNFQFDFSWQISDPYPPDGTALFWQFENDSAVFDVASGPSGNQSVGCGLLRGENRGPSTIVVAIKYAIAVLP